MWGSGGDRCSRVQYVTMCFVMCRTHVLWFEGCGMFLYLSNLKKDGWQLRFYGRFLYTFSLALMAVFGMQLLHYRGGGGGYTG